MSRIKLKKNHSRSYVFHKYFTPNGQEFLIGDVTYSKYSSGIKSATPFYWSNKTLWSKRLTSSIDNDFTLASKHFQASKGHKSAHWVDKGGKGYKEDERHRKEYEEAAGKKRKHHDNAGHKGDHEEEAHGSRGAHFDEKKGHKKGHKTKGKNLNLSKLG